MHTAIAWFVCYIKMNNQQKIVSEGTYAQYRLSLAFKVSFLVATKKIPNSQKSSVRCRYFLNMIILTNEKRSS